MEGEEEEEGKEKMIKLGKPLWNGYKKMKISTSITSEVIYLY